MQSFISLTSMVPEILGGVPKYPSGPLNGKKSLDRIGLKFFKNFDYLDNLLIIYTELQLNTARISKRFFGQYHMTVIALSYIHISQQHLLP